MEKKEHNDSIEMVTITPKSAKIIPAKAITEIPKEKNATLLKKKNKDCSANAVITNANLIKSEKIERLASVYQPRFNICCKTQEVSHPLEFVLQKQTELGTIKTNLKKTRYDIIKTSQCIEAEKFNSYNIHPYEMEFGENIIFMEPFNNLDSMTTYEEIQRMYPCDKHVMQAGLMSLMPKPFDIDFDQEVIYYTNCVANVLATAKRVLEMKTAYDALVGIEFKHYVDTVFLPPILEALKNFRYDFHQWYNSLTVSQQEEVDPYFNDDKWIADLGVGKAHLKNEKQVFDDKLRQVYNPTAQDKFVMGPVVNALTPIFSKVVDGWGVGQTYEDKEHFLNQCFSDEFTMQATMDISGLDKSHNEFITYPYRKVIEFLVESDLIKHVDPKIFKDTATREIYKILYTTGFGKTFEEQAICMLTTVKKLCSGVNFTTDINTIAMCAIHSFIAYRAKIETRKKCSGDDCTICFKPETLQAFIKSYREVFSESATSDIPHGLGLIMKYFRVGELVDCTICSTEVFKCDECGYKMIRNLERFIKFTPWSHATLSMDFKHIEQYKRDLAVSDLKWCNSLSIFKALTKRFMVPFEKLKPIKGKVKKIKEKLIDDLIDYKEHLHKNSDQSYECQFRISEKKECCSKAWNERLLHKYGITDYHIKQIELEILSCNYTTGFSYKCIESNFAIANAYLEKQQYKLNLVEEELMISAAKYQVSLPVPTLRKRKIIKMLKNIWANFIATVLVENYWCEDEEINIDAEMCSLYDLERPMYTMDDITILNCKKSKIQPLTHWLNRIQEYAGKNHVRIEDVSDDGDSSKPLLRIVHDNHYISAIIVVAKEIDERETRLLSKKESEIYYSIPLKESKQYLISLGIHAHNCRHCFKDYTHRHSLGRKQPPNLNHNQDPKQCAHEGCTQYQVDKSIKESIKEDIYKML